VLKNRFRKYLPVIVDLETGGFNPEINAILEIAITLIEEDNNKLVVGKTHRHHINPFEGSIVEEESLEFTKIKLDHPLRNAVDEKDALNDLFKIINKTKLKITLNVVRENPKILNVTSLQLTVFSCNCFNNSSFDITSSE